MARLVVASVEGASAAHGPEEGVAGGCAGAPPLDPTGGWDARIERCDGVPLSTRSAQFNQSGKKLEAECKLCGCREVQAARLSDGDLWQCGRSVGGSSFVSSGDSAGRQAGECMQLASTALPGPSGGML
jgi:hypothetical protein